MKVYIVIGYVPYEGDWIEAVYATRELAEASAGELSKSAKYERYAVDEQEVWSV